MITLECEYCGSEYYGERLSSKYCCDSHKTLASRLRKHNEEIEYERQLQQAELDETISRIEENRKRMDKQAAAELSERMRVADEERKKYKEQQTIKDEMRRKAEKDRRRVEREKLAEKAALNFKLTGLGIISAIGLANLFFNLSSEQDNNVNKPDDKQSNSSYSDKLSENQDKDNKPSNESNFSEMSDNELLE